MTQSDEFKNLELTARALLARAETAERANEAYSAQAAKERDLCDLLAAAVRALIFDEYEGDAGEPWLNADRAFAIYEERRAAASALGREPGGDT